MLQYDCIVRIKTSYRKYLELTFNLIKNVYEKISKILQHHLFCPYLIYIFPIGVSVGFRIRYFSRACTRFWTRVLFFSSSDFIHDNCFCCKLCRKFKKGIFENFSLFLCAISCVVNCNLSNDTANTSFNGWIALNTSDNKGYEVQKISLKRF